MSDNGGSFCHPSYCGEIIKVSPYLSMSRKADLAPATSLPLQQPLLSRDRMKSTGNICLPCEKPTHKPNCIVSFLHLISLLFTLKLSASISFCFVLWASSQKSMPIIFLLRLNSFIYRKAVF